ncbi:macrophage-expressed gene 1 protein-like [Saccostrea cucullata]|uniref:macrophage-expressed gene 1 protein-like n=1 Tax=Saccostrea cuccullata TaxID=36930 RepID=UPI002ED55AEB
MLQELRPIILTVLLSSLTDSYNLSSFNYPPGDIKRCISILGDSVERFEVLPGIGWDNLENRDRSILVSYNFSKCQTTDDGQFIIPDNVFSIPIKTSYIELFGEMFRHWSEFTSTTASSINVETGLQFKKFSISGSFSTEFEKMKKNQIQDKSVTTRAQARFVRYSAKLQPDSKLSPAFQQRLKNIAFYIQKNMSRVASYESQLLVRDFGTHIVSSTDAGAIVTQIDEVKSDLIKSKNKDSSKIIAAVSASFQDKFNINSNFSKTASSEQVKEYERSRTHSVVNTFGGPIFKPHNFTLGEWASKIKTNLVAVDRVGFPIYELITLQSLPDLPPFLLFSVVEHVKAAVEEYYKFNTYRGCTDFDSPNFSYTANVEDGTCSYKTSNFTYGGVFQTCSQKGALNENLCKDLVQKNPLTGDFSCPSGYKPVLLLSSKMRSSETRSKCTSCGFLWLSTCCTNYHVHGTAYSEAKWCAVLGKTANKNGFLFGGIYSSTIDNPVTQTHGCPLYFYPLKIGTEMKVCVSDDFELGTKYSVPFSGFFSCKSGNPYAIGKDSSLNNTKDLHAFLTSGNPYLWPRGCPTGYSMHLAAVESGICEVNYCVKARAFSLKRFPQLRTPPFMELPTNAFNDGDDSTEVYVVNDDRKRWIHLTPKAPSDKTFKPMSALSNSFSMNKGVKIDISFIMVYQMVILVACFPNHF